MQGTNKVQIFNKLADKETNKLTLKCIIMYCFIWYYVILYIFLLN
jgi:hypothetical protein